MTTGTVHKKRNPLSRDLTPHWCFLTFFLLLVVRRRVLLMKRVFHHSNQLENTNHSKRYNLYKFTLAVKQPLSPGL